MLNLGPLRHQNSCQLDIMTYQCRKLWVLSNIHMIVSFVPLKIWSSMDTSRESITKPDPGSIRMRLSYVGCETPPVFRH